MGSFRTVWYLAVVVACVLLRGWGGPPQTSSPEHVLLAKIKTAATKEERQRLIAELEALPNKGVQFFLMWMPIHDAWRFDGWTNNGFDPSTVDLPRDIQLLAAVEFGVADIDNGGLAQFFGNDTGMFAPEMIEWFDRAGMPDGAEILRKSVARFGRDYPRAQEARQQVLAKLEGDEPDPFNELDDAFHDSIEGNAKGLSFDAAADKWLRETCGIRRLSDTPSAAEAK